MTADLKPCPKCSGAGYILHIYDRGPGDPPGNQMVPCDCTHAPAPQQSAREGDRVPRVKFWLDVGKAMERQDSVAMLALFDEHSAAKDAEIERLKHKIIEEQAFAEGLTDAVKEVGAMVNARDTLISKLTDALRGVIKEADRKTDAFDKAHAAIAEGEKLIGIAPPASANRQCPASPDTPGHR